MTKGMDDYYQDNDKALWGSEVNDPTNFASNTTILIQGLRHNEGKPQLSYVMLGKEVAAGESAVWQRGAQKYARGNWLKGMSWVSSSDSLLRHITAFLNGEDLDPETGLPHVDHIVCSAKILSNSYHTRPELDDRERAEK